MNSVEKSVNSPFGQQWRASQEPLYCRQNAKFIKPLWKASSNNRSEHVHTLRDKNVAARYMLPCNVTHVWHSMCVCTLCVCTLALLTTVPMVNLINADYRNGYMYVDCSSSGLSDSEENKWMVPPSNSMDAGHKQMLTFWNTVPAPNPRLQSPVLSWDWKPRTLTKRQKGGQQPPTASCTYVLHLLHLHAHSHCITSRPHKCNNVIRESKRPHSHNCYQSILLYLLLSISYYTPWTN